ncbi:MAG: response regulator [Deltaproteobacteria bacterium]|nr:response regulator [Deltaproteobacteria bacterium]
MADEGKVKVLAVDDSNFMLAVVSSFLKDSRFELVATAKNGKEAMDQYRQHRPDVVLLDIVMPGETGIDTLSQLLTVDAKARVIMVSSLGTEQVVLDCLKRGAKNFLQKPFEKEDLIGLLEKVLQEIGGGS